MSIEAVDLNLILVLHHVLVEGSVARAAERLHVTPSAVSNALARLRQLVGDPLFVRSGRTVVPTLFARELAPQVATAVEGLRHILESRREFNADVCTRASLRVVTLDHAIASDGLASGDIDLLLGLPPMMSRDIRSELAYTDGLVRAMWRKSAPASRRLTLRQFLKTRHVEVALQGKHAIDYVDTALSRLGHQRSIALSVPQFALAAACVVGTRISRCCLPAWRRDWRLQCRSRCSSPRSSSRPLRFCSFGTCAARRIQAWRSCARSSARPGMTLPPGFDRRREREAPATATVPSSQADAPDAMSTASAC